MRQFSRPKEMSNRSVSFDKRLNSYALAASAAGVSLLALGQSSEAKIVYTRTHHVIGNGGSYKLDINHDRIADLTFQNTLVRTCTSCSSNQVLEASLARHNQVVHNYYGAVALKPGVQIGPKHDFKGGLQLMARVGVLSSGSAFGSWVNVNNRYLGVKFQIKGKTHYGWARLNVQVPGPLEITATLTGYAYETVPNKPIIAGKTKGDADDTDFSSDSANSAEFGRSDSDVGRISNALRTGLLGAFALGARGVPLWRRKEPALAGR